jgi:hypothetical protein
METAVSRYQPQLSLRSIIRPFIFLEYNSSSDLLNSSFVFSQNIESIIYQVLLSNIFESTEGMVIFFLITSILIISFSHGLIISKLTFVHAFHFILFTASVRLIFFRSMPFAFIIISQDNNQASFAGDHAISLSI